MSLLEVVVPVPATGFLSLAWLLIAIPALSAAILLLVGKAGDRWGHFLGTVAPLASFAIGVCYFAQLLGRDAAEPLGVRPAVRLDLDRVVEHRRRTAEMDGFTDNEASSSCAATNRPRSSTCPAAPGSIRPRASVSPPNLTGRRQSPRRPHAGCPAGDRCRPGGHRPGYTGDGGATCTNLVNEAALIAARRGHDRVNGPDFADALEKILLGTGPRHHAVPGGTRADRVPRVRSRAPGYAHARRGRVEYRSSRWPAPGRDLPGGHRRSVRLLGKVPARTHRRTAWRTRPPRNWFTPT